MLLMLNTLMDISEAESGVLQLHRAQVRLADVANRAADLYRDVAEAKRITLTVTVAFNGTVLADATRLEQAAANLIDNALKYTPADGRVDVEVVEQDSRALLRVRDNGIGIRAEDLPRIWDRLFRGDTSRGERGLGLGLSLVKAIVEAHGGTLSVASELEKGSAFTASFPA